VVQRLISIGFYDGEKMESKEALGESLIAAAKRGDMSQVRELVENGADPNYCSVHSKIAGINNSRESEFPPTFPL
jgi:uncharacterized membrane protein YvbJ